MTVRIINADCREALRDLPDESVHCVVTSPPYWGLRDYGTGQAGIGLEATMREHLDALVETFREVRRVLRKDGTLWLNYGDAYAGSWGAQSRKHAGKHAPNVSALSANQVKAASIRASGTGSMARTPDLKPKDLMGLPWRLAFALQADGWWLRSDIIWHKPNPMPESVTDRPTRAHEYVFMLSKSARYFFDADAVREPATDTGRENGREGRVEEERARPPGSPPRTLKRLDYSERGRNVRTVWEIATCPFPEAHFATFPAELAERCIKAGCPEGGVVLDPFGGAGTVGLVADRLQRDAILIELNPEYAAMARRRIEGDAPMFAQCLP